MRLETTRLRFREYGWDDLEALYAIISDPETMRHYPAPYTFEQTRGWIRWCLDCYERYGFGLWALELKDTAAFIGDCGLTMQPIDGESLPEIGYHIHKSFWRQGYATEAGIAVRDWAFAHTSFPALYSYMNRTNLASAATARAIGLHKWKEFTGPHQILYEVYRISRTETATPDP